MSNIHEEEALGQGIRLAADEAAAGVLRRIAGGASVFLALVAVVTPWNGAPDSFPRAIDNHLVPWSKVCWRKQRPSRHHFDQRVLPWRAGFDFFAQYVQIPICSVSGRKRCTTCDRIFAPATATMTYFDRKPRRTADDPRHDGRGRAERSLRGPASSR